MRIAASKTFKSPEFLTKLSKGQSTGIEVEVTDLETNNTTTYHAIRAAARALDIDKRYIEHYIFLILNCNNSLTIFLVISTFYFTTW